MIFWTLIGSLLAGLAGMGFYLYFLHRGQFQDPEEVKYLPFRSEEEEILSSVSSADTSRT